MLTRLAAVFESVGCVSEMGIEHVSLDFLKCPPWPSSPCLPNNLFFFQVQMWHRIEENNCPVTIALFLLPKCLNDPKHPSFLLLDAYQ